MQHCFAAVSHEYNKTGYVMLCYVKLLIVNWVRDKKKLHIVEQSEGMCKWVLEFCQQTNILKLPYLPHHQIRQKPCS